jgi:integrase
MGGPLAGYIENGKLHIGRRVEAYGEEGAPKSAAGVRTIPISDRLIAMLKAWKLKSKFKSPDDLIFPNSEGDHIGHDNLIKRPVAAAL